MMKPEPKVTTLCCRRELRPNTICENQTINVIFCECEKLIVANWRYDKIEYNSKGIRL